MKLVTLNLTTTTDDSGNYGFSSVNARSFSPHSDHPGYSIFAKGSRINLVVTEPKKLTWSFLILPVGGRESCSKASFLPEDTPMYVYYGSRCSLSIASGDSLVLTMVTVGSCIGCTMVKAGGYADQCILKTMFVPNSGARDSMVLIGPRVSGGTKYKVHSRLPMLDKDAGPMKLYDLSGRCIDKMKVRRTGVYIATYGPQGVLSKKLMIRD